MTFEEWFAWGGSPIKWSLDPASNWIERRKAEDMPTDDKPADKSTVFCKMCNTDVALTSPNIRVESDSVRIHTVCGSKLPEPLVDLRELIDLIQKSMMAPWIGPQGIMGTSPVKGFVTLGPCQVCGLTDHTTDAEMQCLGYPLRVGVCSDCHAGVGAAHAVNCQVRLNSMPVSIAP